MYDLYSCSMEMQAFWSVILVVPAACSNYCVPQPCECVQIIDVFQSFNVRAPVTAAALLVEA